MGNFCFALAFFPKLIGRKEKDTYWKGSAKGSPGESWAYCLPWGTAGANSIGIVLSLTEELWHLQALSSLNDITVGFKKQDASGRGFGNSRWRSILLLKQMAACSLACRLSRGGCKHS